MLFCSCVFQYLIIAITLRKRELILVFFVRLFDLPLSVSSFSLCLGKAALVVVALPGLFFNLFL